VCSILKLSYTFTWVWIEALASRIFPDSILSCHICMYLHVMPYMRLGVCIHHYWTLSSETQEQKAPMDFLIRNRQHRITCAGAFVAGMDAGHAYNTFPLMGGRLIPEEYWTIPGWRNAFENTAAVQFHHRVLATTTLSAVVGTWLVHRGPHLPLSTRRLLLGVVALTALQVLPLPDSFHHMLLGS